MHNIFNVFDKDDNYTDTEYGNSDYEERYNEVMIRPLSLLAPTGALVLLMVHYISAVATFSDFEYLCLSILLQVSL